jgi:hypothetical protein
MLENVVKFSLMPKRATALTLARSDGCDEILSGTLRNSEPSTTHMSSFSDFKAHWVTQNKDPLDLQRDLIKKAR